MKKSILFVLGILFSFSFLQAQCDAEGGTISTMDPTTICADGNSPDPINVDLTGNLGTNSAWVITDADGNILALPPGPPFDLDGAGAGICLIWHLSHENDLTGAEVGNNAADLGGCFSLSNAITVNRYNGVTDGGNISTTDPTTICAGDGVADPIDVTLTGNVGTNSAWVITDDYLNILALPAGPPFDLEGAGGGICLIWHLSYEDGLEGAVVGGSALDLQGCFSLSPDPIAVTRFGVNGGDLSTSSGATEYTICAGDGVADPIDVNLTGTEGMNSAWVITDADANILALPAAPPFDLDGAGLGTCLIWHLSFQDGLEGAEVGNNAADLAGCFDLSNPITVNRVGGETAGGEIATTDPTEICAGDGVGDPINVTLSGNTGTNSAWVITDADANILALPAGPPFDLDGAGGGTCLIWHLSFEDGLVGAAVGNNAADLQGCYSLSNAITVIRNGVNGGELETASGASEYTICAGDGTADPIDVNLTGTEGTNGAWVITDANANILALPAGPPFDLEGAGAGTCLIWHLSFEDGLEGAEVGNNAADLAGCYDLSNPITVFRLTGTTDGGTISTTDPTEICAGDGIGDPINVTLENNTGTNSAWVITDADANILALPPGPPFDLDGAGGGTCLIWHLSFEDGLVGAAVGNNAADLQGCYSLSNAITVIRNGVNGGDLAIAGGGDELTICAGDGVSDAFDVDLVDDEGQNSAWVITDADANILALPPGPPFDLEGAGAGTCLVWHLSFEDGLEGAAVGNNAADLAGCFDLSNPITVIRNGVSGGDLVTTNDETELTICAGDGIPDPFDVNLTGNEGTNSAWVITDADGNILGLPMAPPFDLEGAGAGVCYVWHLSFEDGLEGAEVGNNAGDLIGCFDLSNPIIVTRLTGDDCNQNCDVEGGALATANDETELTICAGDGNSDAFDVSLTGNTGTNSAWVITDPNGNILGLPPAPPFDLEGAGTGVCYVWNISFEDGLEGVAVGNNTADLVGCYDLSNPIIVTRNGVNGGDLVTTNGETALTICAGDGIPDAFDVMLTDNEGTNSAWVITDPDGNILGLPMAPPFDLEGAGAGECYIWHLSFEDGLEGVALGNNAGDLVGCFDLSNPIIVTRLTGDDCNQTCDAVGGTLFTGDPTEICIGDGVPDPITVTLEGNIGSSSKWLITNEAGLILAMPLGSPFDLEGAGFGGTCLIWHLSHEDDLTGAENGNNANTDLGGCYALSNPIAVVRTYVNGGDLATANGETELNICAGDGVSDAFDVTLTDNEGTNSAWVITDPNGNILGLPAAPPFDLEGAGEGVCYVWHLSFEDGLEGAEVGNNAGDLTGCFSLSNPIIVTRNGVNGGDLATADGETEITICAGDGVSDAFDVTLTDNEGTNSAWVITDPNGNILGLPAAAPFDLEGAGEGVCYVWHLSYEDGLEGVAVGNNAGDLTGCFDLSNPIIVTRNGVNGGDLTTSGGNTELTICAGDGMSDAFDVNLTGNSGSNSAWVITDPNGNILGLPAAPPFDLEGAGEGVCYVWHLSFEDGLEGAAVGNNAGDLEGCFALSNPIIVTRNGVNGGDLATANGQTEITICAGDGIPDAFDVVLTGNEGANSAWVITDPNGNILGLPMAPPFDLEGAGAGTCLVWHLSFEDGLEGAAVGNNAGDLEGCFDLSNPITVTRLTGADCTNDGVDVELDITVDNLLYDEYEHVVYTITATNTGSETATGVTVAAGLPDGMVYSDHDTDDGSYSLYFETWTVGTLEPGETATLELTLFTLVEDVNITNFVQVMTTDQNDNDSTPGNDTDETPNEDDEAAVTITPASDGGTGTGIGDADLSLDIFVEGNEYEQYEHTFFTYTVTNEGPDEATGIIVSIEEPDGFKHTDDDASNGDYNDWYEEWTIPSLASGESATLVIDYYAVSDDEVTHFAQIMIANENDPDSTPGNDTDEVADEDDEASITLTEIESFAGNGGASTNSENSSEVASTTFTFNKLYPNPAVNQISLILGSTVDQETTVNVFNLQGALLVQQSVALAAGNNKVELNVSELPAGAYFIKLTDEAGQLQYKKFTKLNE